MTIKRNSSIANIVGCIADRAAKNKTSPAQEIINALNNESDNLLTGEWSGTMNSYYFKNGNMPTSHDRWSLPYRSYLGHSIVEKIVGLQFVTYNKDEIPSGSTIAFGSKYYSNDEQKALALKHDFQIAKSPSKTQFYFLNEAEQLFIDSIKRKRPESCTPNKINNIYIDPSLLEQEINAHFHSPESLRHILSVFLQREKNYERISTDDYNALRSTLTYADIDSGNTEARKILSKYMLTANGERLVFSSINPPSVIDAIASAICYSFTEKINNKHFSHSPGDVNTVDFKYFTVSTNGWGRTERPIYVKNVAYHFPFIYECQLSPSELESYNNGEDITISIPLMIDRHKLVYSRKNHTHNYYGNTYGTNLSEYMMPRANGNCTLLPFTLTVNKNNPNKQVATLLRSDLYEYFTFTDRTNYALLDLDRLIGYLSENPQIKLVTKEQFRQYLTDQSPRLTLGTYDSLFGMVMSDDENTRKTAAKMLQGFDIPVATNNNEVTGLIGNYINTLALDLINLTNETGASIKKWVERISGMTFRNFMRSNRRHIYGVYGLRGHRVDGIFSYPDDFHPTMTWDERKKLSELYSKLGDGLEEFFRPYLAERAKYYNHTFMENSEIIKTMIDKYSALSNVNRTPEQEIEFDSLKLFTRHYTHYKINAVFAGFDGIHPLYELKFKCPQDITDYMKSPPSPKSLYGEYADALSKARVAAEKNPVAFYNYVTNAMDKYKARYTMSSNSWNLKSEMAFILITSGLPTPISYYTSNGRNSTTNNVTYEDALTTLKAITDACSTTVSANVVNEREVTAPA